MRATQTARLPYISNIKQQLTAQHGPQHDAFAAPFAAAWTAAKSGRSPFKFLRKQSDGREFQVQHPAMG
jgi:hypothetical protein